MSLAKAKRVVVKIGSALLVDGRSGDIRRDWLAAVADDIAALKAADIMSPNPITVDPDARMSDVVDLLTANKISNLFVVEDGRPTAIVHIAELMQAGYVS